MASGGAYYRSVGGRGKGTILQPKDYSGLLARGARNAGDLAKAKQAQEQKDKAQKYNDIQKTITIKEQGDAKWQQKWQDDYSNLIDEASDAYQQYDAGTMTEQQYKTKIYELEKERDRQINERVNSKQLTNEYLTQKKKIADAGGKRQLSPQEVEEENQKWDDWYENGDIGWMATNRPSTVLDKPFDKVNYYNTTLQGMSNDIINRSITSATDRDAATGNFVINQQKLERFSKAESDKLIDATYWGNPRYKREVDENYNSYMAANPSAQYSNALEWEKANYGWMLQRDINERIIKTMPKDVNIGFGTPVAPGSAEDLSGTFTVNYGTGNIKNQYNFTAPTFDGNSYFKYKGTGISQTKKQINRAMPYYTASGKPIDPTGEYFFGGGNGYFPRIADRDMSIGAESIKKGSPIPDELLQQYEQNGGKWSRQAWHSARLYENQTAASAKDDIYHPVKAYLDYYNQNFDPVKVGNKMIQYGDYLIQREQEYNKQSGTTPPGTQSGNKKTGASKL